MKMLVWSLGMDYVMTFRWRSAERIWILGPLQGVEWNVGRATARPTRPTVLMTTWGNFGVTPVYPLAGCPISDLLAPISATSPSDQGSVAGLG